MLYIEKINEDKSLGSFTENEIVASSLGWTITKSEFEIEQSYDGSWWIKGFAPIKPLEALKQEKVLEIKQAFQQEEATGYVVSSLGFNADATRSSKQDIDGLVQIMEISGIESIPFRDYENNFHELNLSQMKTLQMEIIQKGLDLYQKKWSLEQDVHNTTTQEQINSIVW